jgi:hypothetical protein
MRRSRGEIILIGTDQRSGDERGALEQHSLTGHSVAREQAMLRRPRVFLQPWRPSGKLLQHWAAVVGRHLRDSLGESSPASLVGLVGTVVLPSIPGLAERYRPAKLGARALGNCWRLCDAIAPNVRGLCDQLTQRLADLEGTEEQLRACQLACAQVEENAARVEQEAHGWRRQSEQLREALDAESSGHAETAERVAEAEHRLRLAHESFAHREQVSPVCA